ncbi:MAG: hypothetical protein ABII22_07090 [Candidatus Micrarchaeota archaeon]
MDKIVIYVVATLVLLGGVFLVISPSLTPKTPSKYGIMLFVNMDYTNGSNIEGSLDDRALKAVYGV